MVLPAPRRAHQRDQVAGQRLEAHVVEQRLHLPGLVAIGHLQDQIPRFDLVERPARPFRRVLDDDRDLLGLDLNQQRHRADEDLFAACDRDALPRRDALAAHVRAVRAAAVLEEDLVAHSIEPCVFARDLRVIDDDVVSGGAADALEPGLLGPEGAHLRDDRLVTWPRRRNAGGGRRRAGCGGAPRRWHRLSGGTRRAALARGRRLGQRSHQCHDQRDRHRDRADEEQRIGWQARRLTGHQAVVQAAMSRRSSRGRSH